LLNEPNEIATIPYSLPLRVEPTNKYLCSGYGFLFKIDKQFMGDDEIMSHAHGLDVC